MTLTKPNHRTWAEQAAVWGFSGAILASWVVIVAFVVTAWYPWNPVTKLSISIVGQPRVGDDIRVRIDYCKTREWTPREVRWSLQDDIVIVLERTTMSLPVGCRVVTLTVPGSEKLVPGGYQLQEEVIYQPWPWREFLYVRRTPPFHLLPAGEIP